MVAQKYRWDFIGLSTDTKPTAETSEKVVNGSTYYCSDTSKLYVYCNGTWYERKPLGGGGGGGTSNFNDLSNRPKYNGSEMTGSTNIPEVKSYTAGTNVSISDQNVISATDTTYTAGTNVSISDQNVISATDTTYSNFTGTDGTAAGAAGLVPAPATTDAGKYLKADGTWDTVQAGPTVVQTTGTSTTDVMSQNATTSMVFADPSAKQRVQIGNNANADAARSIALGNGAAIGSLGTGGIALGAHSYSNTKGEMNIGSTNTNYGYNNSNYRLISGVYDGQSAHDAATKGQLDSIAIQNAGAPTTATVGTVGQLLEDTTNGKLYICTDTTGGSYTWAEVGAGGSGPTVVQTTGTSTTDVMSQNAVTSMVFADPVTQYNIKIGNNAKADGSNGVALGAGSKAQSTYSIALGDHSGDSYNGYEGAISIGRDSKAKAKGAVALGIGSGYTGMAVGEMHIGTNNTTYGYNSSNYRLLTGLYDGQSAHDAATVGQIKMGVLSATPTGTTAGFPGRLYTYDSGGGTYEVYLCVHDNGDNTYVWKQVSLI